MDAALWGFVGVVIGGIITGVVSIAAEQIRANKEAALDGAKRSDNRRLARDEFARETLLALQDTMTELTRLAVEMKARLPGEPSAPDFFDRYRVPVWRLLTLNSRVADSEVRDSVAKFASALGSLSTSTVETEIDAAFAVVNELAGEVSGRTGVLIRATFEEPTQGT